MIEHHVHYNADTSAVERIHHLPKLPHPRKAVVRVRGIRTLRAEVIQRVVPPVVGGVLGGLIDAGEVERGEKMDVGYPQFREIIKSRRIAERVLYSAFGKRRVFSPRLEIRALVHRKVADMKLADHRPFFGDCGKGGNGR